MYTQVLKPDEVHANWFRLAALLAMSVDTSDGELEVDDIPQLVDERKMLVGVVCRDDGYIQVALAMEIITSPRMRILHITHIGSDPHALMGAKQFFSHLEDVAKRLGCSMIQGFCRPAAARLFRRAFGLKPVYTVLRREVDL